jgi:nicotinamide mononucleotide (NMN) deamidase PncC
MDVKPIWIDTENRRNQMTDDILKKVQAIHEAKHQIVIATAGAGHSALGWLLNVPGASRTLLEAIIPYSREAMADFIGYEPEKSVSQETAWAMAEAAYNKAKKQTDFPLGIACTATIRTVEPKRGDHRAIIVSYDKHTTSMYSITLDKGIREREEEEIVVSYLILIAICQAMKIDTFGLNITLMPGDIIEKTSITTPQKIKVKE